MKDEKPKSSVSETEKVRADLFDPLRTLHQEHSEISALPALLVGVYQGAGQKKIAEEYLEELKLLCKTFGISVIDSVAISMRTFTAATFLSVGKLEEIKEAQEKLGAKLIIFDDEISPAQQRNMEKFFNIPVIDRAEIILGVFAQRAKTREAKLQIELAEIKYMAPRLKRLWTHLSRQAGSGAAGGGAYLKGVGEKQIEIDKRILKRKFDSLQREINEVKKNRLTQRGLRLKTEIPTFALVGYTNAGKSTVMKALTSADVLIEDKLFATLDTTTRKLMLPQNQEVLVTDTVGFIRKLPHLLVMAFRSTLEEAVQADVLIHVIDATHPMAVEQAETTLTVIKELNAGDRPVITVLNKMDMIDAPETHPKQKEIYQKLRFLNARCIDVSAINGTGLDTLKDEMQEILKKRRGRLLLRIPQKEYHMVTEAMRAGHVYSQEYEGDDVVIDVELPLNIAFRFKPYSVPLKK